MCKQLCEQTEEGRAIWERWRTKRDNWAEVRDFHRERVLEAMRKRSAEGGAFVAFLTPRDGGPCEVITGEGGEHE